MGGYTAQYIHASGAGQSSAYNTVPQESGYAGALTLVNEGVWFVRPGANLKPAYASKYFAFYSQNDWKVATKLTLNLGLRYEVQPGVRSASTARPATTLSQRTPLEPRAPSTFPGPRTEGAYRPRLWATGYNNWTPHVGFAWRITPFLVARGGFGMTYLPSNSGYFSSPNDYGEVDLGFRKYGFPTYGAAPAGIPTEQITDAAPYVSATLIIDRAPDLWSRTKRTFRRNMRNAYEGQY